MGRYFKTWLIAFLLVGLVFPSPVFAVGSGTWTGEETFSLTETDNWQKTDWAYRESITISNAESAQTDYPVKITIPFVSGMNADFSDLRFVNETGDELSYWIQEQSDSVEAIVWVNVVALENGDNSIFLYFGNEAAESESDGEATFLFFDDFSGASLDSSKWNKTEPAGETFFPIVDGELEVGKTGAVAAWNKIISTVSTFNRSNLSMEWKYRWDSNINGGDPLMMGWKDNSALVANAYYKNLVHAYYNDGSGAATTVTAKVYEDGSNRAGVSTSFTQTTQYLARVRLKTAAGAYVEQSSNDGNSWTTAYNSNYSSESNLHPAFALSNGVHHIDDVRVRPWLANEPTSSIGDIENHFAESETFESEIFDSGEFGSYWGTLSFSTTLEDGVEVRVRSGDAADLHDASDFASCEALASGVDLSESSCVEDGEQYLQYQVTLFRTDNVTPVFSSISIPYVSTEVVAQTGIDRIVVAGKSIPLSGGASEGENLSYLWAIFSGVGSISNETTAVPTYNAPAESSDQNVHINMTIQDDFGQSSTDTVTVHIEKPVAAEAVSIDLAGMLNTKQLLEVIAPQGSSTQLQLSVGSDSTLLFPLDESEYSYEIGEHGTLAIGLPEHNDNTGSLYVFADANALSGEIDLSDESGEFDTFLGRNSNDHFGQYLSVLDLGDDATDDIIVSSPHHGGRGSLDIYNSSLELVAVMLGDGTQAMGSLGKADLTGDGADDLILGPDNPRLNKNLSLMSEISAIAANPVSKLLIYSGTRTFANVVSPSTMTPDVSISSDNALTAFAVADFNGDGEQDIAVADDAEIVSIFFGKFDAGTALETSSAPSIVLSPDIELFGSMLAAGDVNGDGFADVIVGAPDANSGAGAIYILFGQAEFADTIDVSQAGNVMKVSGLTAGDNIGQDLLLADIDANGTQEIFTLSTENDTYMVDLSELVEFQAAASSGGSSRETGVPASAPAGNGEETGNTEGSTSNTSLSGGSSCSMTPYPSHTASMEGYAVFGLLSLLLRKRKLLSFRAR